MAEFNPDNVPQDKLVHVDTISGKSLTYGGLRDMAGKCAWGLRHKLQHGLKEGQRLLAIAPNSSDFVLLAHSTWWAGACFSPLNMSSTAKDIAHALALVQPSYVAVDISRLEAVKEAMQSAGLKIPIMTLFSKAGNLPLFPDDVIGHSENEKLPPYDLAGTGKSSKTTTAAICFSSGTTGKFKAVQLSHYNIIINILQTRASLPAMANSDGREVFFPPCMYYGHQLHLPPPIKANLPHRLSRIWNVGSGNYGNVVGNLYLRLTWIRSRDILSEDVSIQGQLGTYCTTCCCTTCSVRCAFEVRSFKFESYHRGCSANEETPADEAEGQVREIYQGTSGIWFD